MADTLNYPGKSTVAMARTQNLDRDWQEMFQPATPQEAWTRTSSRKGPTHLRPLQRRQFAQTHGALDRRTAPKRVGVQKAHGLNRLQPTTAPAVPLELLQRAAQRQGKKLHALAKDTSKLLVHVASEDGPFAEALTDPSILERPSFSVVLGLCMNIWKKTGFFRSISGKLDVDLDTISSFQKIDLANRIIDYIERKNNGHRVHAKAMNICFDIEPLQTVVFLQQICILAARRIGVDLSTSKTRLHSDAKTMTKSKSDPRFSAEKRKPKSLSYFDAVSTAMNILGAEVHPSPLPTYDDLKPLPLGRRALLSPKRSEEIGVPGTQVLFRNFAEKDAFSTLVVQRDKEAEEQRKIDEERWLREQPILEQKRRREEQQRLLQERLAAHEMERRRLEREAEMEAINRERQRRHEEQQARERERELVREQRERERRLKKKIEDAREAKLRRERLDAYNKKYVEKQIQARKTVKDASEPMKLPPRKPYTKPFQKERISLWVPKNNAALKERLNRALENSRKLLQDRKEKRLRALQKQSVDYAHSACPMLLEMLEESYEMNKAYNAPELVNLLKAEEAREQRDEAATKIQAIQRGRMGRQRVLEARAERKRLEEEMDVAATKIQSLERGRKARRRAADKRQQEYDQQIDEMATRIQSQIRGRQDRKRVARMKEEIRRAEQERIWQENEAIRKEQDAAAIKIQALQRGKQGRRESQARRAQLIQEAEEREAATIKLQAFARGKKDRKRVAAIKAERDAAASKIQAQWKGKQTRFQLKKEKESAAKIQALYRGNKARNEVKLAKADLCAARDARAIAAILTNDSTMWAATLLQSKWKGRKARKLAAEKTKENRKMVMNDALGFMMSDACLLFSDTTEELEVTEFQVLKMVSAAYNNKARLFKLLNKFNDNGRKFNSLIEVTVAIEVEELFDFLQGQGASLLAEPFEALTDEEQSELQNALELWGGVKGIMAQLTSMVADGHEPFANFSEMLASFDANTTIHKLLAFFQDDSCVLFSDSTEELEIDVSTLVQILQQGDGLFPTLKLLKKFNKEGLKFNNFGDLLEGMNSDAVLQEEEILAEVGDMGELTEEQKQFQALLEFLSDDKCVMFHDVDDTLEIDPKVLKLLIDAGGGFDSTMEKLKDLNENDLRFDSLIDIVEMFTGTADESRPATALDLADELAQEEEALFNEGDDDDDEEDAMLETIIEFLSSDEHGLFDNATHDIEVDNGELIVIGKLLGGGKAAVDMLREFDQRKRSFENFQLLIKAMRDQRYDNAAIDKIVSFLQHENTYLFDGATDNFEIGSTELLRVMKLVGGANTMLSILRAQNRERTRWKTFSEMIRFFDVNAVAFADFNLCQAMQDFLLAGDGTALFNDSYAITGDETVQDADYIMCCKLAGNSYEEAEAHLRKTLKAGVKFARLRDLSLDLFFHECPILDGTPTLKHSSKDVARCLSATQGDASELLAKLVKFKKHSDKFESVAELVLILEKTQQHSSAETSSDADIKWLTKALSGGKKQEPLVGDWDEEPRAAKKYISQLVEAVGDLNFVKRAVKNFQALKRKFAALDELLAALERAKDTGAYAEHDTIYQVFMLMYDLDFGVMVGEQGDLQSSMADISEMVVMCGGFEATKTRLQEYFMCARRFETIGDLLTAIHDFSHRGVLVGTDAHQQVATFVKKAEILKAPEEDEQDWHMKINYDNLFLKTARASLNSGEEITGLDAVLQHLQIHDQLQYVHESIEHLESVLERTLQTGSYLREEQERQLHEFIESAAESDKLIPREIAKELNHQIASALAVAAGGCDTLISHLEVFRDMNRSFKSFEELVEVLEEMQSDPCYTSKTDRRKLMNWLTSSEMFSGPVVMASQALDELLILCKGLDATLKKLGKLQFSGRVMSDLATARAALDPKPLADFLADPSRIFTGWGDVSVLTSEEVEKILFTLQGADQALKILGDFERIGRRFQNTAELLTACEQWTKTGCLLSKKSFIKLAKFLTEARPLKIFKTMAYKMDWEEQISLINEIVLLSRGVPATEKLIETLEVSGTRIQSTEELLEYLRVQTVEVEAFYKTLERLLPQGVVLAASDQIHKDFVEEKGEFSDTMEHLKAMAACLFRYNKLADVVAAYKMDKPKREILKFTPEDKKEMDIFVKRYSTFKAGVNRKRKLVCSKDQIEALLQLGGSVEASITICKYLINYEPKSVTTTNDLVKSFQRIERLSWIDEVEEDSPLLSHFQDPEIGLLDDSVRSLIDTKTLTELLRRGGGLGMTILLLKKMKGLNFEKFEELLSALDIAARFR